MSNVSDIRQAILGLRVGDNFEDDQPIYALCGAVPIPACPEELPPDVLNPLITAADTTMNSKLIVTHDYVIHLIDDSTTRLIKSNLSPFLPKLMVDTFDALIDDEDQIIRWHRDSISSAESFRYEYETRGLWGGKILPLYYYVITDVNGYQAIFLQNSAYKADQTAHGMATQLEVLMTSERYYE